MRTTTSTIASDTLGSCGEDNKGGCEHICQEDGNGRAVCLCYRGYVLSSDQVSCTGYNYSPYYNNQKFNLILFKIIDVDECSVDNGGCEGQCTNRQGSFQCSCSDGFRLASNGKKCIGMYIDGVSFITQPIARGVLLSTHRSNIERSPSRRVCLSLLFLGILNMNQACFFYSLDVVQ